MRIRILAVVAGCSVGFLFTSGCTTIQEITYPITDIQTVANARFTGKSLTVKTFADARETTQTPPPSPSGITRSWASYDANKWPKEERIIQSNGMDWYFNHNDNYRNKTISPGISQMIANHLNASHMFASVSFEGAGLPHSDYVLEGTIKKFEGYKEYSAAALLGRQIGPIGTVATAGVKSRYEGTTLLIDVTLIEGSSGKPVWQGTVQGHVEGVDYADASGWSAYLKANLSLKQAVDNLIQELRQTK